MARFYNKITNNVRGHMCRWTFLGILKVSPEYSCNFIETLLRINGSSRTCTYIIGFPLELFMAELWPFNKKGVFI
jgi:hypothetical protein